MKKLVIFLIFLIIYSCSTQELKELGALPKKENIEYLKVLNNYTKTYKLYDEFATKAIVSATMFSEEFLKYYFKERERYSKEEDFKIFTDRETFLNKNYFRFFVSFYTPKEELSDIDKSNSVWNIYIESSDGKKISPFSIKKAEENYDILNHYFPYLDPWAKSFYINFKKEDLDFSKENTLTLKFVSILGTISLDYSLK